MGLDVYLNSRAEQRTEDAFNAAWERFAEQWEDKPDSPDKQAAVKALPTYEGRSSVASERYPDHFWNRRYLRSSYNGAGFNRAVPDMVGEEHDLYWIFEPVIGDDPEPYEIPLSAEQIPDLEATRERAVAVAAEIRASDPLRTTTVSTHIGPADHMWSAPPTQEQALAWYREEKQGHEGKPFPFGEGYSCAKGDIMGFSEGLEVLGATLGRDVLGQPCGILIYRMNPDLQEEYAQAAEIAAEFCDEAIELIKRDGSCVMSWSG